MIKFIDKILLNSKEYSYKTFNFDVNFYTLRVLKPYMHSFLKKKYTHSELTQFTQGELSQYA